jgi:hypothetical protein
MHRTTYEINGATTVQTNTRHNSWETISRGMLHGFRTKLHTETSSKEKRGPN